ncbi:MAG: type IV pilus biogenesis/stability protein PilW [Thioalkalivibrio sp.]|nr:type IV pilus biogenesis/stability protein PilW [Thioalkalivibrio sp.]
MRPPGGLALASIVLGVVVLLGGCAATTDRPASGDRAEAAEINAKLGVGYLREGEFEQAERNLERALEFDSGLPLANIGMAAVYERKGSTERAEEHYRVALRRDPDNPYAQTNLATLLCGQGRYEEARMLFSRAIGNPDYDRREIAHTNAGNCHANEGNAERAERHLRQALEIDSSYAPALLAMARLTYAEGRPMQTRAFLQRLESQGVVNAETLLLCYRAERALGNRRAANDCAERLNRNHPESSEINELRSLERAE